MFGHFIQTHKLDFDKPDDDDGQRMYPVKVLYH